LFVFVAHTFTTCPFHAFAPGQHPATDALLRYVDSQFLERHPRLGPMGARHPFVLTWPRSALPAASGGPPGSWVCGGKLGPVPGAVLGTQGSQVDAASAQLLALERMLQASGHSSVARRGDAATGPFFPRSSNSSNNNDSSSSSSSSSNNNNHALAAEVYARADTFGIF
jgi:hypothetical protein